MLKRIKEYRKAKKMKKANKPSAKSDYVDAKPQAGREWKAQNPIDGSNPKEQKYESRSLDDMPKFPDHSKLLPFKPKFKKGTLLPDYKVKKKKKSRKAVVDPISRR